MSGSSPERTDEKLEQILGNLLRAGVLVAAAIVLCGAMIYLFRHGGEPAEQHHTFHGEPADLRSPSGIIADAFELHGRGIIQLGLLLLIATPVARVIFAAFAFGKQRDATYVLFTVFVLVILIFSLFFGGS